LKVDATTASVLYSGIFTDTAGFSLQNATADSFRSAAELVDLGADVVDLGERLDRSQRQSEFRLLKTIYANTRWTDDERIAYSTADFDEIGSAGCSAADIDDQVQVPRSLNGIHMAILFTEGVKGKARLNFRGEQGIRVLDLAKRFGGGGHAFAAGTILEMSIAEAVETVLPVAQEEIDRQLAAKV
jgi:phosphoesterase RecJ-like protein